MPEFFILNYAVELGFCELVYCLLGLCHKFIQFEELGLPGWSDLLDADFPGLGHFWGFSLRELFFNLIFNALLVGSLRASRTLGLISTCQDVARDHIAANSPL